MYSLNNIKRRKKLEKLKRKRKELLKEMEVGKRKFVSKLPRVTGKGEDFEIDEKKKGKKASLVQQVLYLTELEIGTREIRQQMKDDRELIERRKKESSTNPEESEDKNEK